jgi:pimeloyl-ACP methyl ester carboxylesterase
MVVSKNTANAAPGAANTHNKIEDLRLTLDGIAWRYQRAGSGPPLLLVHGLFGYSFSWRFTIPALAQLATVYAMDMPGTGLSDHPRGLDCSMHACAERLLRFMDALKLAQCDVLATSHGGGVTMTAAALAPGRFRRMILVAPVNPWSQRGRLLSLYLTNPLVAPALLTFAPRIQRLQEFYLRRLYGDPRRIPPDSVEGYLGPVRQRPGSIDYGLSVLRTWNQDLRQLQSLLPRSADIPTLLIWGSLDGAVSPASATPLKQKFHQCRLLTFDGIGHLPYEESPKEFNRAVIEFLGSKP